MHERRCGGNHEQNLSIRSSCRKSLRVDMYSLSLYVILYWVGGFLANRIMIALLVRPERTGVARAFIAIRRLKPAAFPYQARPITR